MTARSQGLYGLILAGGHSKRMGQDKAMLSYHGKSMLEHAYTLLEPFTEHCFVSVRQEQKYKDIPTLKDLPQFSDIGPLGGILSAMTTYPQASWLVFACDLPFITTETISYLITNRDPSTLATAFISTHDQLPEPLCAIWEGHSKEKVFRFLEQEIQCPRKILIKSNTHLIGQKDPRWLDNVNTQEEYTEALQIIQTPKGLVS